MVSTLEISSLSRPESVKSFGGRDGMGTNQRLEFLARGTLVQLFPKFLCVFSFFFIRPLKVFLGRISLRDSEAVLRPGQDIYKKRLLWLKRAPRRGGLYISSRGWRGKRSFPPPKALESSTRISAAPETDFHLQLCAFLLLRLFYLSLESYNLL